MFLGDMPRIPIVGDIPIVGQLIQKIPIIGSFFGHGKPKMAMRDIRNMVSAQARAYAKQYAQQEELQAEADAEAAMQNQIVTGQMETRQAHLLTTPLTQQFGKQGELIITVAPPTIKKIGK